MTIFKKHTRVRFPLKIWNILGLSALRASTLSCAVTFLHYFYDFTLDYHHSLLFHRQTLISLQEVQVSEVNNAYVALKIWLLLARKTFSLHPGRETSEALAVIFSSSKMDENVCTKLIWNELWPPFERLLQSGDSYPDQTLVRLFSCNENIHLIYFQTAYCNFCLDHSSRHISIFKANEVIFGLGIFVTDQYTEQDHSTQ